MTVVTRRDTSGRQYNNNMHFCARIIVYYRITTYRTTAVVFNRFSVTRVSSFGSFFSLLPSSNGDNVFTPVSVSYVNIESLSG